MLSDSVTVGQVEPPGLTGKDPRIDVPSTNDPNALAVATANNANFLSKTFETKPHFHEWLVSTCTRLLCPLASLPRSAYTTNLAVAQGERFAGHAVRQPQGTQRHLSQLRRRSELTTWIALGLAAGLAT